MFGKVKAVIDCARGRVSAAKREVDNRISEMKRMIDGCLLSVFPPKYRRAAFSVSWVTGRFFYEFFSILWGAARWFGNLLLRIATFWQVVFLNKRYKSIFAGSSLFSLSAAYVFLAPEFFIIIFLLIIIPFFFACLCTIAAKVVLEFIYLFFKFMPPVIWVSVVAVPLGFVAALATVRTGKAWEKRKEVVYGGSRINNHSIFCY